MGTVVYLKWGKNLPLSRRIVLRVGRVKPRNGLVAALWRESEEPLVDKDTLVIVCQLTYLVLLLCFLFF